MVLAFSVLIAGKGLKTDLNPSLVFGVLQCNGLGLAQITPVRVGIAHVRSSIYVAHPTSDSQFSAVLLFLHHYIQEFAFSGSASQWSPIQRSLFTSPCFISSIHRVLSYQEEKAPTKVCDMFLAPSSNGSWPHGLNGSRWYRAVISIVLVTCAPEAHPSRLQVLTYTRYPLTI
jgi:hypothetical protein